MEKRVILFLIISLVVIVGYDFLLKEFGLLPPPAKTEQQTLPEEISSSPEDSKPVEQTRVRPKATSAELAGTGTGLVKGPAATEGPLEEQLVEVETNLFRARLTNRGAVIKSWELKRYHVSATSDEPVHLVYSGGQFNGPLALSVSNEDQAKAINSALYYVSQDVTRVDATHPVGHVTFRYRDSDHQVLVEKQLTFRHDSYVVDMALKTEGLAGPVDVGLGTNFGIVEWGEGFIGLVGSASSVDGKVVKETPDTELEQKGDVAWTALQDKYFISVLLPSQATAALAKKEGDKLVSAGVRLATPAPGTAAPLRLYAGPKEYDTLKAMGVGLEDTIDFGWFIFGSWSFVKAVAKPLFYVLRFLYEFTHNYGVTIVLLTVGVKLLFVPLQYKSYKSMKQMQTIQPKVAALQTKYKDDKERLNKELIKLYRDHKVNPVGGCLPMVLQMPVFVALFNILYMTIDLRHAPFILWINDLSVQDPYYVLPIIMGASMILQQKIMPTTMDPTQAKIMLMLPAFMTFLFITFPAGLVLYWLTNNVLTITQQVATDRFMVHRWTMPKVEGEAESAPEPTREAKGSGKRRKGKSEQVESASNK